MSMRYPGGFIASTPVTAGYPSGVWTQAQAIPYQAQNVWTRDQYWPYTTLLLQGDGATNGAQNNTFLDSSSNNFTITRNGNTTQGSFTPYEQDGYWSNYFDGASYLLPSSNAAFNFGTGDFTVEAWVYQPASGTQCVYDCRGSDASAAGFFFGTISTNFGIFTNNTVVISTPMQLNTWMHFAIVRSGSTWTLYKNGVLAGTYSSSANLSDANRQIGASTTVTSSSANYLTGYISNLRVIKGTAVYTSAFTPSTAPLTAVTNTSLLTCQSNRFKDNSTNNFAITVNGSPSVQAFQPFPGATTYSGTVLGGSGYFDGSGDYLAAPDNAALEPGSSDLTWEMWINTTNSTQYATLYSRTPASFATGMWSILMNFASSTAGDIALFVGDYNSGATALLLTTGVSVRDGAWHHIAIVRNGSAWTLYVDGISRATQTWSGTIADISGGPYIGRDQYYGRDYTGYISNLRVLKGTAAYTSAFTPPTAPVTAITNTSLLLNFTNAGIFDAAVMNDLETVGNAQVSTSVVKYGTGSMAFDGTDDRLTAPASVNMAFGTGDFTVEGWFYTGTPSSNRGLFQISGTAGGLQANNLNNTAVYCNSSVLGAYYGGTFKAGTTPIVANTWTHFALVRNNSVTRLYVNGVADSGFGANSDTQNYTGQNLCVGGYFSTSYLWNGYIDDLRITKGAARYITNFTPPPARMPGQ